jgi:hypothetical protein
MRVVRGVPQSPSKRIAKRHAAKVFIGLQVGVVRVHCIVLKREERQKNYHLEYALMVF